MRTSVVPILLALSVLGGCVDDPVSPTEPSPAALFSCLFGEARVPAVGEVVRLEGEGTQTLCLGGGANGAEYLYVPFYAADVGTARLRLELTGGGFEPAFVRFGVGPSGRALLRTRVGGAAPPESLRLSLVRLR